MGAFWEDRYHATAVKTSKHLIRCLAYIDLNMVRAGAVKHPGEWVYGGYREIQNPKQRYTLIDRQKLTALFGIKDNDQLTEWTQSIAVGDKEFVKETKAKLGAKAIGRKGMKDIEGYELKESQSPYNRVFDPEKCGQEIILKNYSKIIAEDIIMVDALWNCRNYQMIKTKKEITDDKS